MRIVTQTSNLILETRTYETVTSIKIQGRLGICKSQAREFGSNLVSVRSQILILVAFITGNSSLEPLIEGLYAQIHVNLRWRVFGRNRTGQGAARGAGAASSCSCGTGAASRRTLTCTETCPSYSCSQSEAPRCLQQTTISDCHPPFFRIGMIPPRTSPWSLPVLATFRLLENDCCARETFCKHVYMGCFSRKRGFFTKTW